MQVAGRSTLGRRDSGQPGSTGAGEEPETLAPVSSGSFPPLCTRASQGASWSDCGWDWPRRRALPERCARPGSGSRRSGSAQGCWVLGFCSSSHRSSPSRPAPRAVARSRRRGSRTRPSADLLVSGVSAPSQTRVSIARGLEGGLEVPLVAEPVA